MATLTAATLGCALLAWLRFKTPLPASTIDLCPAALKIVLQHFLPFIITFPILLVAMAQRLTWQQIIGTYPDEWVALIDAKESATQVQSGVVIAHAPSRQQFNDLLKKVITKHPQLSISYTGPLVSEADTPLLWQISSTSP